MEINIEAVGFKADAKLEAFIEKKIIKLSKFNDSIVGAEVKLRLESSDTKENKVVEINLNVPNAEIFAKRNSASFEEAADSVSEALRKQLQKRKEKQTGR